MIGKISPMTCCARITSPDNQHITHDTPVFRTRCGRERSVGEKGDRKGVLYIIFTLSAIFRINRDKPVVIGGGNSNTRQKPLPNPKFLPTF